MNEDLDSKCDREDYEFFHSYDFPELFEPKITFGMYEGQTYDWIYENDESYFMWLIKNVKRVRKYLNQTLKKRNLKINNKTNKIEKR